jgi:hypothetical protein
VTIEVAQSRLTDVRGGLGAKVEGQRGFNVALSAFVGS